MGVKSLFRSGLLLGLALSSVGYAQPNTLVASMRLERSARFLRESRDLQDLISENSRGPAGSQGPVIYLECVGLAEKARAVADYTRRTGIVFRDEQDAIRDMARALIRDADFVQSALSSLRPNENRGWDSRGRWNVRSQVEQQVQDIQRAAQELMDELRSGFRPGGRPGNGGGGNGGWNGPGWGGGGNGRPPVVNPLPPVVRPNPDRRPDYIGYALVEADFDLFWDFTIHLPERRLTPANGEEMRAAGVGNTTFRLSDNARVEMDRNYSPDAPVRYEVNVVRGSVASQSLSPDGRTLFLRLVENGGGVGTATVEVKFYQDQPGRRRP